MLLGLGCFLSLNANKFHAWFWNTNEITVSDKIIDELDLAKLSYLLNESYLDYHSKISWMEWLKM